MVSYSELSERFHNVMSSDSLTLVSFDDFSKADELPDLSREAFEKKARNSRNLADLIMRHDFTGVHEHALELELAENWLRAQALEIDALIGDVPIYAAKPNAIRRIIELTPNFLERDTRDVQSVIDGFIKRFSALDLYLMGQLSLLERPAAVWANTEIEVGETFPSVAQGIRQFATNHGYKNMPKLDEVLTKATHEVQTYLQALKTIVMQTQFSIGHSSTEKLLKYKGIIFSPEQLHAMAMTYIEASVGELEAMKEKLIEKYGLDKSSTILQVAEALKTRFASPKGQVIAVARGFAKQAETFAYNNGLIQRLENERAEILSSPQYIAPLIPIAAVITPRNVTGGTGIRRSTIYITEREGVEKQMNKLTLPMVTAHELMPGHHYQMSRATEHPSKIRRWTESMDLAEGWTTRVAEQLLPEMGYYGNPQLALEESYMARVFGLRLAGRVCYVLACLTGDVSYFRNNLRIQITTDDIIEGSVQLYRRITGFSEAMAKSDVETFASEGIYGALYLVGNVMMHRMETMARAKHGGKFSFPKFLEAIVKEGNMPLSYVQRSLQFKGVL